MTNWKVKAWWWIIALISPFILLEISLFLSGKHSLDQIQKIGVTAEFPHFTIVTFFIYNLFSFGFGEETGWRGFALPRLQAVFHPLVAVVFLTILWAGWHLPFFFYREGFVNMNIYGVAGWILSLLTGSILLSWLYNSTKSILVVSVFHATIDVAFTSEATSPEAMNYLGFLITLAGIIVLLATKFKLGSLRNRSHHPPPSFRKIVDVSHLLH